MRIASPIALLILSPLLLSPQWAAAEVFKCTTPAGKTSYSQSPCTAADATEAVVPIVAAPPGAGAKGRDWAAENAAANARVRASEAAAAAANAQRASASAPAKSTQQGIAECEANHGVNCSSAEEVAKRESADRPLTPEEETARQNAAAGRRELERAAAEAKAKADAKPPAIPAKPAAKTGT